MNIKFEKTYTKYHDFEQVNFIYNNYKASIIIPKNVKEDKLQNEKKKWIWRTEFLGAFDNVDLQMLEDGYYLVYYAVSDMYGCDKSILLFKKFYDYLVSELNFYKKTILFGFSRGGLYALNFATLYPSTIASMYLDAPVIDIASWPGGLGKGAGSEKEYIDCLKLHGLTAKTVYKYKEGLAFKFNVLTDNEIPLVLVTGNIDEVVPHDENSSLIYNHYINKGKQILYIVKVGCNHHPHSVCKKEDINQIVSFLKINMEDNL